MQNRVGMRSKVHIAGHPVHPQLVHFPIALYTIGLVSLVVHLIAGDAFWYRASFSLVLIGAAVAVLAAVVGIADLLNLHRNTTAWKTGVLHASAALLSTILFTGAAFAMYFDFTARDGVGPFIYQLPLALEVIGFGVLLIAGVLGSRLVAVHLASVSSLPEVVDAAPDVDDIDLPTVIAQATTPRNGTKERARKSLQH
jgi:uncharacterized membrane protein